MIQPYLDLTTTIYKEVAKQGWHSAAQSTAKDSRLWRLSMDNRHKCQEDNCVKKSGLFKKQKPATTSYPWTDGFTLRSCPVINNETPFLVYSSVFPFELVTSRYLLIDRGMLIISVFFSHSLWNCSLLIFKCSQDFSNIILFFSPPPSSHLLIFLQGQH